jgi:hypothetical protein
MAPLASRVLVIDACRQRACTDPEKYYPSNLS